MTSARILLISSVFLFLCACATAPVDNTAEDIAKREADFESQRLFEEARLQEQREREAAERTIFEQQALRELDNSKAEAEAAARPTAEAEAQREADLRAYRERNAEPSRDQTVEKTEEVARVQAKVADLRNQIAANKAETAKLESNNAALREAITAAEELSKTLAAEQQKYTSTDPANGQPVDALAKARIDELKAQIEQLKAQAAALSQPSP
ncbi:MAG: hypothetical protein V4628_09625 [Pseudomonadota bacterium]